MLVHTLWNGGRLGTASVTLVYVFVGIFFQYILGLSLAMLTVQRLPGRRFFRVVFLLPMMITPVGVAYMFRMLTDTSKGPFTPIWQALGLINFSWVNNAWGARTAIFNRGYLAVDALYVYCAWSRHWRVSLSSLLRQPQWMGQIPGKSSEISPGQRSCQ